MTCLQNQGRSNYFFSKSNLLANPGHFCEDDYFIEADKIHQHLVRYFDESLMSTKGNSEFSKMMSNIHTEMLLLLKWRDVVDGLMPPSSTRGRRICFAFSSNGSDTASTQYTYRQLQYIGCLLKNLLAVKESIWQVF